MMHAMLVCLVLVGLAAGVTHAQTRPARSFRTGVDANYALDLKSKGKTYAIDGKPQDLFAILASAGADSFRVRLWTGDEGFNGLKYATETARRAQQAGLKPYLVIFLSENWADMVKQPVPAIWKDLDEPAKLVAIEAYADRVTRHFTAEGIDVDYYEIGNEIDFGICGVFEEEWPKRVSRQYMQEQIWSKMAPIIAAAQRGVRKSKPDARFMLHLAQWAEPEYCVAFWQYMLAHGVAVDLPGLSYFPTSAKPEQNVLTVLGKHLTTIHDALKRPVVIAEYGYPSTPTFPGQFADWNKPVDGYPLDEAGQTKWLADFLVFARASDHLAGAYYWSPEWNDANMWDAFALFDAKGQARPAIRSFGK